MIEMHEYKGKYAGIRIAITGAIHGNEVCGTKAMRRIIQKIDRGNINLLKGSLLLIPVCNQKAYEQNIRFIDENLNRVFKYYESPKTYEQGLANELTSVIGECDLLIDLHSIHSKGFPFIMNFGTFSEEEENIKKALGVRHFIHGWAEAYERSFPSGNRDANSHTVSFMHSLNKMAIGVECGLHEDEESVNVAEMVILNALSYLGMIDGRVDNISEDKIDILIDRVFLQSEGESFVKKFTHGEKVQKGAAVTNKYIAENDSLVLFPRENCPNGEEIFYTGNIIYI